MQTLYKTNGLRTSASKTNRKTEQIYSFLLHVILNRDFKMPASRNTERRNQSCVSRLNINEICQHSDEVELSQTQWCSLVVIRSTLKFYYRSLLLSLNYHSKVLSGITDTTVKSEPDIDLAKASTTLNKICGSKRERCNSKCRQISRRKIVVVTRGNHLPHTQC